jgi:hypothetical protein
MSKLETNTVDSISGTSTLTLGGSNASVVSAGTEVRSNKLSPASGTALQIGDSGDTITIPSGATIVNSGTQTGFGGDNTPMVSVDKHGGDISISATTHTKVTLNTERADSDNAFSSNTFTVPSGKAGKYFMSAHTRVNALNGTSDYTIIQIANSDRSTIYATTGQSGYSGYGYGGLACSVIRDLSAGDTVSLYTYSSEVITLAEENTNLTIIKLIE